VLRCFPARFLVRASLLEESSRQHCHVLQSRSICEGVRLGAAVGVGMGMSVEAGGRVLCIAFCVLHLQLHGTTVVGITAPLWSGSRVDLSADMDAVRESGTRVSGLIF
jgi:hypothetical protein